jgi:hypothetical protein
VPNRPVQRRILDAALEFAEVLGAHICYPGITVAVLDLGGLRRQLVVDPVEGGLYLQRDVQQDDAYVIRILGPRYPTVLAQTAQLV